MAHHTGTLDWHIGLAHRTGTSDWHIGLAHCFHIVGIVFSLINGSRVIESEKKLFKPKNRQLLNIILGPKNFFEEKLIDIQKIQLETVLCVAA